MLNAVQGLFRSDRALVAVIHYAGWREAVRSVQVAIDQGAHGVVLINQGTDTRGVVELLNHLKRQHGGFPIGVNILGNVTAAFEARPSFVWCDNGGCTEALETPAPIPHRRPSIPLFGGFSFKGQHEVPWEDLPRAAAHAALHLDVVTTSGAGTGIAADPAEVERIRSGLGAHPLGLASGVTAENVDVYLPSTNAFLVGTGIESSFGVVDATRVRALADKVRAFEIPTALA